MNKIFSILIILILSLFIISCSAPVIQEEEKQVEESAKEEVIDPIQDKLNEIKQEYSLRYMANLKKINDEEYLNEILASDEAIKAGYNFFNWGIFEEIIKKYKPKDFERINNTFENMENRDSYLEYMVNEEKGKNLFDVEDRCKLMKKLMEILFSQLDTSLDIISSDIEKLKKDLSNLTSKNGDILIEFSADLQNKIINFLTEQYDNLNVSISDLK